MALEKYSMGNSGSKMMSIYEMMISKTTLNYISTANQKLLI